MRRKGPAHQATASILRADGIQRRVVTAFLCLRCSKCPRGAPTGQRSAAAVVFSPPHQQHPQARGCPSSTSPGQKGARRSWGQPQAEEEVLQAPLGMEGETQTAAQSRGGRCWRGLWESLYLICFSLFKNKPQSSGRGEVGGNACAGGEGGRAGQQPEKQLLTARPEPGKRLSSIPTAKRHQSQGERPPAEAARTLFPPRPSSSAHGWRMEHPTTPGPAQLGTFWQNRAVQEVGEREDGMKKGYHGSTDWPEVPQGDMGIPACAKPQLTVLHPASMG